MKKLLFLTSGPRTSGLLIFFLFMQLFAPAQSRRNAKPAEIAAINKAIQVVLPLMNSCSDNNWEITEGGADEPESFSLAIDPDIPMNVAPFNDWTFAVKENSDLWNQNFGPMKEKLLHPPSDYNDKKAWDEYNKLAALFKNQQHIYVEVHVNEYILAEKPVKGGAKDLKIPGCYFSYKQSGDKLMGTNRSLDNSYVLAFGNWDNAKHDVSNDVYQFHYVHPAGTPFLENIVVILSGNDEAIREWLKTRNWNSLNNGLTR